MHIQQRPDLPLHGSFRPIVRREALELILGFLPTLELTPEAVGLNPEQLPAEMAWDDFARVMAQVEPEVTPSRLGALTEDLKRGYSTGASGMAMRLVRMAPNPVAAMSAMSKFAGVRIFPAVASNIERVNDHTTRLWLHIPEPLTPSLGFLKMCQPGNRATFELVGQDVETSYHVLDGRTAYMEIHKANLSMVARCRAWVRSLRGHRAALEELSRQNEEMESQLSGANAAREEAKNARAAAEDALRVRNAFLRRLSHELRTPIHQCVSMMELAQTEDDAIQRNSFLQTGQAAGWDLLSTLEDLLDLTHLDSDAMALHPETVALEQCLRGVAQTFYPRAQRESRELVIDVPEHLSCVVDRKRLVQILRSLMDNAFKHGKGRVALRAHAGLHGTVIEVDDQGEGPGAIPKLGLFEVGDGSTTRSADGLGLGLTLVPRLVRVNGGHFALEEAPGGGTRARLTFPTKAHQDVPKAA